MKQKVRKISFVAWISSLAFFVLFSFELVKIDRPLFSYFIEADILFGIISFTFLLLSMANSGDNLAKKAISPVKPSAKPSGILFKPVSLRTSLLVTLLFFLGLTGSGILIGDYLGTKEELNKLKIQQTVVTPFSVVNAPTPIESAKTSVKGASTQKEAPPTAKKIDCTGPDGKHLQITQKECDDFNNAWKNPNGMDCEIFSGNSLKTKDQAECDLARQTFVQMGGKLGNANNNNQQSVGNNVYCWNNTYNVGYYTTSGDKCNEDNFKDGVNKLCQNTQTIKLNGCNAQCQRESDTNKAACVLAYGQNGKIADDPNKYGECLLGPGGDTELYAVCVNKCTDQYTQDLKQCK